MTVMVVAVVMRVPVGMVVMLVVVKEEVLTESVRHARLEAKPLGLCSFHLHRVSRKWFRELPKVPSWQVVSQDSNMGCLTLTISTKSHWVAFGEPLGTLLSLRVHRPAQRWVDMYLFVRTSPLLRLISI